MRQVGAGEIGTSITVATFVERPVVAREGGVEEVELAGVGHRAPVAAAARRIDAIEEIASAVDRRE